MSLTILWISHDPVRTSVTDSTSSSGFWKEALLEQLQQNQDLKIITCFPGPACKKLSEKFYTFRYKAPRLQDALPSATIRDLQQILNEVQPQLIHVHGTEIPYALISAHTSIPVVISLQGFISECYQEVLGKIALPVWKKATTLKERILRNGFLHMHAQWYYNAACEIKTIQQNRHFIGRTSFDHDVVMKHNPDAHYYTGNELLRDAFYNHNWQPDTAEPYTIYTSSATNPLKGFHVLLDALRFLKKEFPAVKLRVPGSITPRQQHAVTGNSYYRIIQQMMEQHQLQNHIQFCGKLNADEVVCTLQKTQVFVLPSFIENSSNALGEAQVLGVPCVTTNSGGTSSLIKDRHNGLFFRTGDGYDLAQKIKELFLNRELAWQLSQQARMEGLAFHDQRMIAAQYSTIYQQILAYESTL